MYHSDYCMIQDNFDEIIDELNEIRENLEVDFDIRNNNVEN